MCRVMWVAGPERARSARCHDVGGWWLGLHKRGSRFQAHWNTRGVPAVRRCRADFHDWAGRSSRVSPNILPTQDEFPHHFPMANQAATTTTLDYVDCGFGTMFFFATGRARSGTIGMCTSMEWWRRYRRPVPSSAIISALLEGGGAAHQCYKRSCVGHARKPGARLLAGVPAIVRTRRRLLSDRLLVSAHDRVEHPAEGSIQLILRHRRRYFRSR